MMVCGHVPAQVAAVCFSKKKSKEKVETLSVFVAIYLHIAGNDMRPHVPIWVLCK